MQPIADHVNDMAGDMQCQLKDKCKDFVGYSIAIDESTDIAQLAVFIRGANEDFKRVAEFLELVPIKGKIGADEVFFLIGDTFLQMLIALGIKGRICE